jgi:hypothetical protein
LANATEEHIWSLNWSREQKRQYYFNHMDGESTWTRPNDPVLSAEEVQVWMSNQTALLQAQEGWSECSGAAMRLSDSSGLRRAYRELSRRAHPDKGGSSEEFDTLSQTRNYLKSPLRYLAYRALHPAATQPSASFAFGAEQSKPAPQATQVRTRVRTVRATIRDIDGWPHMQLEAEFEPANGKSNLVDHGNTFMLALSAKGVSTIEYKGEERVQGYDVCCNFLQNSRCQLRSREDYMRMMNRTDEGVDEGGGKGGGEGQCAGGGCREPESFSGETDREEADGAAERGEGQGKEQAGPTCECVDTYQPSATTDEPLLGDSVLPQQAADKANGCEDFMRKGYCPHEWYQLNCRRSCGLCGSNGNSTAGAKLEDKGPTQRDLPQYVRHDCPLAGSFTAEVTKPLHVTRTGEWAAVLLLFAGDAATINTEVVHQQNPVCITVRLGLVLTAMPPKADPPQQKPASDSAAGSSTGSSTGSSSSSSSTGSSTSSSTGSTTAADEDATTGGGLTPLFDQFETHSLGRWCADGADILEGPLDSYTDCDPATGLCKLTKKCRERCAKRKRCKYYTTYSSGFCQLSAKCKDQKQAKDPSARTYRRR